jgi:hypothetical protein
MEEMFARLVFDLKLDQELLPWGYFEIMIGTGLGGWVHYDNASNRVWLIVFFV